MTGFDSKLLSIICDWYGRGDGDRDPIDLCDRIKELVIAQEVGEAIEEELIRHDIEEAHQDASRY